MTLTGRHALLTALAMVAFAANSLLCRLALDSGAIDAASFTTVRMVSGALVLGCILAFRPAGRRPGGSAAMALMLFVYMLGFSLAYRSLTAATGALLLFGAVQLTMFARAVQAGERFGPRRWVGVMLALGGLVWLLLPGVSAPDPFGAAGMVIAGVAWGAYSLLGRGSGDPLADTAGNFFRATPLALFTLALLPMATGEELQADASGVGLAVLSGALASGLGYAIWYAALRGLDAGRAATVQLSVPVIAALGGVVLLAEPLTSRLVVAGVVTLGGVWLALAPDRENDRPGEHPGKQRP
jgi:drug/metabolite transporter (DMT)-like permease